MIKLEFNADLKGTYPKATIKMEHNKTNSFEMLMLIDTLLEEVRQHGTDESSILAALSYLQKSRQKKGKNEKKKKVAKVKKEVKDDSSSKQRQTKV